MPGNLNMAAMLGLQPSLYAAAAALVANNQNNQANTSSSSSTTSSSSGKNGLNNSSSNQNHHSLANNSGLNSSGLTGDFMNSAASALLNNSQNEKTSDSSDLASNFNLLNQLSSMDQGNLLQALSKLNANSTFAQFSSLNHSNNSQSNRNSSSSGLPSGQRSANNKNSNDQNEMLVKNFGSLLLPGAGGVDLDTFKQRLQHKKKSNNQFSFNLNSATKGKQSNQSKLESKSHKLNNNHYSAYSTDNSCSDFEGEDDLNDELDDEEDEDENDMLFKTTKDQLHQELNKAGYPNGQDKLTNEDDEPIMSTGNRSACASPMDDCQEQQSLDQEMMSVGGSSRSASPLANHIDEQSVDPQQQQLEQELLSQGIDLKDARQFYLNESLKRNLKSLNPIKCKQTGDDRFDYQFISSTTTGRKLAANEDDELKENHLNSTEPSNLYKFSDLTSLQAPKFSLKSEDKNQNKSKASSLPDERPSDSVLPPDSDSFHPSSPIPSPKHLKAKSSPMSSPNRHLFANRDDKDCDQEEIGRSDAPKELGNGGSQLANQLMSGQLNNLFNGLAGLPNLSDLGVDLEQLKSNSLAAAIAAMSANAAVTQSLLNSAKNNSSSINNNLALNSSSNSLNGNLISKLNSANFQNSDLSQLSHLSQLSQLSQRHSTSSPFDDNLNSSNNQINLNHSISSTSSAASMSNLSTISSPQNAKGKMLDNKLLCRDANEVGQVDIPYDKNNPKVCVVCNKQFQVSHSFFMISRKIAIFN